MHGRQMGMTSLAEDFKALGAGHLLPGGVKNGAGRRQLREDVQTSGHGTSYSSPGSDVSVGLRRPDDEGRTDPNRTSEGRRRSRLREEEETDEDPFATESDELDPELDGDEPYGESSQESDGEAIAADGDDDDLPSNESAAYPPRSIKIGEVRVQRPGTRKAANESRRYSNSASRFLSRVLGENRKVLRARSKMAKIVEGKLRERGLRTRGGVMNEVRTLIESMKQPSSRFDDFVDAFNAVANLDEAMTVKWAQLESRFAPPPAWGKKVSFKKLAEASLVRATDACVALNEMSRLKSKRLNRTQTKQLEETLDRLGREQMTAFGSLCDTLVSVGLAEDVSDLPGVDDVDDELDAPAEGRRRTESDELNLDALDPDEDPDLGEGDDEGDYSLDGQDDAEARFDGMSHDELVKECSRLSRAMGEIKGKMREDGRMPTDIVPESRMIRPRMAPLRRGK